MLRVIITIILTSGFFILFFGPGFNSKNKRNVEKVSTIDGFVEDTYRGPFTDKFITPKYGEIGTFTGYSSVSEYNWLNGFPHESGEIEVPVETSEEKLQRRKQDLMSTLG
jgi:hypothetical protein|tara:strand:- start:3974 stop:4303 length:330 start_codon:yes stop_codon:yes gene_type:complete